MDEDGGTEEPAVGDRSDDGGAPPGAAGDRSGPPAAGRSGGEVGDQVGRDGVAGSALRPGPEGGGDGELSGFLGRASLQSPDEFVRMARERKGLDPSVLADPDDGPGSAAKIGGGSDRAGDGGAAANADVTDVAGRDGGADAAGAAVGAVGADVGAERGGAQAVGAGPGGLHGGPDGGRAVDSEEQAAGGGGQDREVDGHDRSNEPGERSGEGPDRSWRRWPIGPRPEIGVEKWNTGSVRRGPYSPGVAGIGDVLDGLVPAGEVDDESLHAELVDLVRLRSRLDSVIAGRCREWDSRGLWAGDGSKSPSARLARDANCSKTTAGAVVHVGRASGRMPLTADAFEAGRISTDHVRRLVDACTDERLESFVRDEPDLVAEAERWAGDFNGFKRIVRCWELAVDDDLHDPTDPDAEPPGQKRARTGRDFRMAETPDGFDIRGSVTKADGAVAQSVLQRIYDELWEADWAEAKAEHGDAVTAQHLRRTVAQRRADAFLEMCKRAAGWTSGGAVARPLISVLVNYEDLAGPIRQTFNGTVLSRRDVAEMLTEADFERVVFGPTGQPTDITSRNRFFVGPLRRAVQIRDRMCSHPTCDVDADRCQVDHIVEVVDGGTTSIENARLLCPRHNQQRPGRGKKPPPSGRDDGDGDGDGGGDSGARDDGGARDGGATGARERADDRCDVGCTCDLDDDCDDEGNGRSGEAGAACE